MSWKNFSCMGSWKKGRNGQRKKKCCCGGHNATNAKSNLSHNATRRKLGVLQQRKFVLSRKTEWIA